MQFYGVVEESIGNQQRKESDVVFILDTAASLVLPGKEELREARSGQAGNNEGPPADSALECGLTLELHTEVPTVTCCRATSSVLKPDTCKMAIFYYATMNHNWVLTSSFSFIEAIVSLIILYPLATQN